MHENNSIEDNVSEEKYNSSTQLGQRTPDKRVNWQPRIEVNPSEICNDKERMYNITATKRKLVKNETDILIL